MYSRAWFSQTLQFHMTHTLSGYCQLLVTLPFAVDGKSLFRSPSWFQIKHFPFEELLYYRFLVILRPRFRLCFYKFATTITCATLLYRHYAATIVFLLADDNRRHCICLRGYLPSLMKEFNFICIYFRKKTLTWSNQLLH